MLQRLDVIVLGLLREQPRTGYDVRKWLDRYGWALGYTAQTSQIYRHVARLVHSGWATSSPDPRTSGPDAKLYRLTEAGLHAFEEWVDSPYEPAERPMEPDFQVRMLFSRHRGPEALLGLVRAELAYRRPQHERLFPVDLSPVAPVAGAAESAWDNEVGLMLNHRGRLLAANLIAWLEATEERLVVLTRAESQTTPHSPRSRQETTS